MSEELRELLRERDELRERNDGLATLLNDMFGDLCGLVPPEQAQHWADQMENLGVYPTWGWRG